MADSLRFLRLGLLNILGYIVPGILLISLFIFGVLFPITIVLNYLLDILGNTNTGNIIFNSATYLQESKFMTTVLFLVFSYIGGYIIRLSSPDQLDMISAKKVIMKMNDDKNNTNEIDIWPCKADDNDLFPYFYYKIYLISRGLNELARWVNWGPEDTVGKRIVVVKNSDGIYSFSQTKDDQKESFIQLKRSKNHINKMKLEVYNHSQDLSAIIESNEAHIRLIFGSWSVFKICLIPLIISAVLTGASLVLFWFNYTISNMNVSLIGFCLLIIISLILISLWSKNRIENLFHYQRVRELTQIIQCYNLTKK